MATYYDEFETENENERGAKMKELTKNVGKTIKNFTLEHKRDLMVIGEVLGAMYISYKVGSLVTANEIKNQLLEMAMNGEITFNKN